MHRKRVMSRMKGRTHSIRLVARYLLHHQLNSGIMLHIPRLVVGKLGSQPLRPIPKPIQNVANDAFQSAALSRLWSATVGSLSPLLGLRPSITSGNITLTPIVRAYATNGAKKGISTKWLSHSACARAMTSNIRAKPYAANYIPKRHYYGFGQGGIGQRGLISISWTKPTTLIVLANLGVFLAWIVRTLRHIGSYL